MTYIRWLNEIQTQDQPWAGEKATRLGELVRAGFAAPRGCAIGASAYRDAFAANRLNEKIVARLAQIEMSDPAQLEQATDEFLNAGLWTRLIRDQNVRISSRKFLPSRSAALKLQQSDILQPVSNA